MVEENEIMPYEINIDIYLDCVIARIKQADYYFQYVLSIEEYNKFDSAGFGDFIFDKFIKSLGGFH
jgi:hypothetical protein